MNEYFSVATAWWVEVMEVSPCNKDAYMEWMTTLDLADAEMKRDRDMRGVDPLSQRHLQMCFSV